MGEVVNIKPVQLHENHEFVSDCCRFQESILTEARMKLKYGFAEEVWQKLGDNTALLEAVEDEKIRRIRTGTSKREKAQLLVVKAPDVVAKIMLDDNANPRHRIDAAASLDKFAANGPENAPAAAMDRFVITINLNGDVEHYNKSISINADDVAPNDGGVAPARSVITSIPDKRWDSDDVVGLPAQTNIKAIERETGRVEKTPQER